MTENNDILNFADNFIQDSEKREQEAKDNSLADFARFTADLLKGKKNGTITDQMATAIQEAITAIQNGDQPASATPAHVAPVQTTSAQDAAEIADLKAKLEQANADKQKLQDTINAAPKPTAPAATTEKTSAPVAPDVKEVTARLTATNADEILGHFEANQVKGVKRVLGLLADPITVNSAGTDVRVASYGEDKNGLERDLVAAKNKIKELEQAPKKPAATPATKAPAQDPTPTKAIDNQPELIKAIKEIGEFATLMNDDNSRIDANLLRKVFGKQPEKGSTEEANTELRFKFTKSTCDKFGDAVNTAHEALGLKKPVV